MIAKENTQVSTSMEPNSERRVLVVMRWPVGGIRTHILYTYPTLVQRGYRFTFVGPCDPACTLFYDEVSGWNGTECIQVPTDGIKCNLRPVVRRLLRQGRFCLMHSHGFMAASQAVVANLGLSVPHISTSHDVIRPEAEYPGFAQFSGLKGAMKRWLLGHLIRRVHVLVTLNPDVHENTIENLPPLRRGPCRVVTIPNGINVARFTNPNSEDAMQLRSRLGLAKDVYLMGYIGRVEDQKGFLTLMEAIDRVAASDMPRPFHLAVVGRGECPGRYRPEMERRPRLAEYITFLDPIPNIAATLPELDLVVMPSLWEACPLLPMEAMCAGVPLLGSNCIGLKEVLRDTPSRMVSAGDPLALEQGIRKAMMEPWDAEARDYAPIATKRFDVSTSAERLMAVFDDFATMK